MKAPFKKAWDEFREANPTLFVGAPIGVSKGDEQYLQNRIWRGFDAGWNAAVKAMLRGIGRSSFPDTRTRGKR